MSMSTHVVGFRPADEKWEKMKAVWDACKTAGVEVPQGVERFFGGEGPGDKPGMEVDLSGAVIEWSAEMKNGYEVNLAKLPPDVTIIRFYNSY